MTLITHPMFAGRIADGNFGKLKYPMAVTKKIDGIRCLIINGKALSRTFKPIPNKHIAKLLTATFPDGTDLELTSGANFQDSTSAVMSEDKVPEFKAWVIDYVKDDLTESYSTRMENAARIAAKQMRGAGFQIEVLTPKIINTEAELLEYEKQVLAEGFEGVMIRQIDGRYKCGRSTFNEGLLIKLKRFNDQEARVVDFEELYHNQNTAEKDAFGRTKRSTAQDGMVAAGTLGKLIVVGIGGDYNNVQFSVGSGFDQATRDRLWKNKGELVGKVVRVKYFPTGVKDAPRFPIFQGFRDKRDM